MKFGRICIILSKFDQIGYKFCDEIKKKIIWSLIVDEIYEEFKLILGKLNRVLKDKRNLKKCKFIMEIIKD